MPEIAQPAAISQNIPETSTPILPESPERPHNPTNVVNIQLANHAQSLDRKAKRSPMGKILRYLGIGSGIALAGGTGTVIAGAIGSANEAISNKYITDINTPGASDLGKVNGKEYYISKHDLDKVINDHMAFFSVGGGLAEAGLIGLAATLLGGITLGITRLFSRKKQK